MNRIDIAKLVDSGIDTRIDVFWTSLHST